AVRRTKIEEMVLKGRKGARAVNAAVQRMDRTIAAVQLGVTFASLGLGWVGEPALAHLIEPGFAFLSDVWGPVAAHTAATVVTFLLITFMHVVFGELIPKTMALQRPDEISLWMARPLMIFARLTRPLIVLMGGTANAIVRLLGFAPASGEAMLHSVEELALLI